MSYFYGVQWEEGHINRQVGKAFSLAKNKPRKYAPRVQLAVAVLAVRTVETAGVIAPIGGRASFSIALPRYLCAAHLQLLCGNGG